MPNLQEIKERRGKMKGTPWKQGHLRAYHVETKEGYRIVETWQERHEGFEVFERNDKAEFIANAPTDIDWLVQEVEKLWEENKRLIKVFSDSDKFIVVQLGYALGWNKGVDLELANKEVGVETMDDYLYCVAGNHTAETLAMTVRALMEHPNDHD